MLVNDVSVRVCVYRCGCVRVGGWRCEGEGGGGMGDAERRESAGVYGCVWAWVCAGGWGSEGVLV